MSYEIRTSWVGIGGTSVKARGLRNKPTYAVLRWLTRQKAPRGAGGETTYEFPCLLVSFAQWDSPYEGAPSRQSTSHLRHSDRNAGLVTFVEGWRCLDMVITRQRNPAPSVNALTARSSPGVPKHQSRTSFLAFHLCQGRTRPKGQYYAFYFPSPIEWTGSGHASWLGWSSGPSPP